MPKTVPMTDAQRPQRALLANEPRWSHVPYPERAAQTAKAREALWAKYQSQVEPAGCSPRPSMRRSPASRRADMARMSLNPTHNRSRKAAS